MRGLFIHTPYQDQLQGVTPISIPPLQRLCGVQGQLRTDGTRIKTLLAQQYGQCTKRWRVKKFSQGARPWASAACPVEGERENFGSAGRWLAKLRNSGLLQLDSPDTNYGPKAVKMSIQSRPFLFLQDLFSSSLRLLKAGLVLLFSLEGRGISAYPTLPTPRLLHVNLLGSRETEAN